MIINPNDNNWRLGELVSLSWNEKLVKKSGKKSYAYYAVSRYICIREATDGQSGILVKVLGRTPREHIILVNGEPFCKDEGEDLLKGRRYFSYPFPTVSALKEVLEIVGSNPGLLERFEEESMHINPASTFWVRETASHLLRKEPQYYDASSNAVNRATDNTAHYRLTIAYFNKNE